MLPKRTDLIWGFPEKWGYPKIIQNRWFISKNTIKWMILGYPYLWKSPYTGNECETYECGCSNWDWHARRKTKCCPVLPLSRSWFHHYSQGIQPETNPVEKNWGFPTASFVNHACPPPNVPLAVGQALIWKQDVGPAEVGNGLNLEKMTAKKPAKYGGVLKFGVPPVIIHL